MEYNLVGLVERVRIDKLDDDEFDAGIISRFLNDAQRDIFNQFELPFQEKIFRGTIPAGSTMFKLPSDVAQVQTYSLGGVAGFSGMKMPFREFFQAYPDAGTGKPATPGRWTKYAGNILLAQPTDKDYTMTLFYIRKPKMMSLNTDVPEIPEEFSEMLVLGAYIRVLKRNEDFELAREVALEYDRQLLQLVNRYGQRDTAGPIKIQNQQRRG